MRRLLALVLLAGAVSCGSTAKPQAQASPSDSPTPEPTVTESAAPTPPTVAPTSTASRSASPRATATATPSPRSLATRYTASGRVVRLPGKPDQLCAPTGESTVSSTPPACAYGLTAVGLDFATLKARRETGGAIDGYASVVATLDAKSVLHVESQGEPAAEAAAVQPAPPCTPPAGGWPHGKKDEDLDLKPVQDYRQQHPGTIVEVALLRPSADQVLAYVLTSGDPAQVDKDLRPSYGKRFCAFRSRWSRSQADRADVDVAFRYGHRTGVFARDAGGLSAQAQLEVVVGVVLPTPALQAAVAKHPAGLVRLAVFLQPLTP